MKNKLLILVSIYSILLIIQSCCDGNEYEYYNITDLSISSLNKYELETVPDSTTISMDSFAISIDFDTEIYASLFNDFSIVKTANAFDCDDGKILEIVTKISSIYITSNVDFDSTHPKGSDLSDFFHPYSISFYCINKGGSFTNCAQSIYEYYNSLEEVFNKYFSLGDFNGIDLLDLTQKPDYTGYMKFYIDLEFEDGTVISDSTNFVKIE